MSTRMVYPATDGSQSDWTIPFDYLSRSHVKVKVDGADASFIFLSAYLIKITPAPKGALTIYRETPSAEPVNKYTDGSVLLSDDLNLSFIQSLFLAAEVADRVPVRTPVGDWDMLNLRLVNVADPVDKTDGVNRRWVEEQYSSGVQAGDARDQAQAARDVTLEARDVAVAAKNTAVDRATTSTTKAAEALASANTAVSAKNIADTKAAEASTSAADALASKNTSSTKAAEAATSAAQADAAKTASAQSSGNAYRWSSEAENVEVNDGVNYGYSAYHWSKKAEVAAGGGVQSWAGITGAISKLQASTALSDVFLGLSGGSLYGRLVLPASTSASAFLQLPHGVNPTTPVNGEIWTTTGGLSVRVNGANRTMWDSSSLQQMPGSEAQAGTATTVRTISAAVLSSAIASAPVGAATQTALSSKADNAAVTALQTRTAALESFPRGVGDGQAWVNVTSSRAAGTTYTNNTGRPIMISVTLADSSTGNIFVNGVLAAVLRSNNARSPAQLIIPNNHTYHLASGALDVWSELR